MRKLQFKEPTHPTHAHLDREDRKRANSTRPTPLCVFLLAIASLFFGIGCQSTGSLDIVDRSVNVLVMPGGPTIPKLFEAGVIRVSTGSAISMAAQSTIVEVAKELLDERPTECRRGQRCAEPGI